MAREASLREHEGLLGVERHFKMKAAPTCCSPETKETTCFMAGKEFIQEFWNVKSKQLGFNSRDETAHQKVGSSAELYFPPGGLGRTWLVQQNLGTNETIRKCLIFPPRMLGCQRAQGKEPKCLVSSYLSFATLPAVERRGDAQFQQALRYGTENRHAR